MAKKNQDPFVASQIAQMEREYAQRKATADARSKQRIANHKAAIQMEYQQKTRQMYFDSIDEALAKGEDPSYLFSMIRKAGLDPELLLDQVIEKRKKELREQVKKVFCGQIEELLNSTPTASLESVITAYKRIESDDESVLEYYHDEELITEAYNEVQASYVAKYEAIVNNAAKMIADDADKALSYINEQKYVTSIFARNGKTLDSCLADAKSQAKSALLSKYDSIVKNTAKTIVDNIEKGVEYINSQKNISTILECAGKTLDECINEAKDLAKPAFMEKYNSIVEEATKIMVEDIDKDKVVEYISNHNNISAILECAGKTLKEATDEAEFKAMPAIYSKYDSVVSGVAEVMEEDVDKGTEYANSQNNISAILQCVGKTIDDCVYDAKQKLFDKRIKLLEEKINDKEFGVLMFYLLGVLIFFLGFKYPIAFLIALISIIVATVFLKFYMKDKKAMKQLTAEKDDLK